MKFLVITAIREFEKEIKQILKASKVETFSYQEVTGYKQLGDQSMESNWFAGDMHEQESLLFYAFLKEDFLNLIFEKVEVFNAGQETASKIHIAVLNIEKTN